MPPRPNSRSTLKCETVEPIKGDSQESHLTGARNAGQIESREAERLAAHEQRNPLVLLLLKICERTRLLIVHAQTALFRRHVSERQLQAFLRRWEFADLHWGAGNVLGCIVSRALADILIHHDGPILLLRQEMN